MSSQEAIVFCGDVLEILAEIEDDCFDAVFCDPPYGISFMGRRWDHGVPSAEVWREVMRVLKPGGHLMAFGGTRTYHRLACNIEDAGFELRDCLMWLYGSGFPKGADLSKLIDKRLGAEREVVRVDQAKKRTPRIATNVYEDYKGQTGEMTAPATPEDELFDGYRTALKPAWEPCILAMKPKSGSYAENAVEHGVAGLNIDGGRIPTDEETARHSGTGNDRSCYGTFAHDKGDGQINGGHDEGRYPANLILDPIAADLLDAQAGDEKSRFFYCAKASKAEREAGPPAGRLRFREMSLMKMRRSKMTDIKTDHRRVFEIVNRALDTIDALEAELKEANGHLHRVSKGYKTIGAYDALEAERDELRARVTNQLSELISLRASVLGAKELERQRDEALEWLRKCETLFERYIAASAIDLDWREMDELPQPMVRIVTGCPTTGTYEHDGSEVDSHILEPGDDVRLRFDGERLHFADSRDDELTTAIIAAVNWIDSPEDEEVRRSEVEHAVRILRGVLKAEGGAA